MLPNKKTWQASLQNIKRLNRQDQRDAILRLGDDPSDCADLVLINLLDNTDPNIREQAMEVLCDRSNTFGRIAARALLEDSCTYVRNRAADVLGLVGKRLDAHRLRLSLRDSDWVVRASAADSLGRIGGKAAHPALVKGLKLDVNPVVRRDAAYALSHARDKRMVPVLEAALSKEKSEQSRIGLFAGLYALGQHDRLSDLLGLLRSGDDIVRHATVNQIEEVVLPADHNQAAQKLREMIAREDNPGVKSDAAELLEKLTTPNV